MSGVILSYELHSLDDDPQQVIGGTFYCHSFLVVMAVLLESCFPKLKQMCISSETWSVLQLYLTVFKYSLVSVSAQLRMGLVCNPQTNSRGKNGKQNVVFLWKATHLRQFPCAFISGYISEIRIVVITTYVTAV